MPLLRIQTNQAPDQLDQLLTSVSKEVADQLGKPERYVMVSFEHNPAMLFAGTNAPLAYLELKSIGLPEARTADFSSTLCAIMERALDIPRDRVYIEFSDAPRNMWGWNGATF